MKKILFICLIFLTLTVVQVKAAEERTMTNADENPGVDIRDQDRDQGRTGRPDEAGSVKGITTTPGVQPQNRAWSLLTD